VDCFRRPSTPDGCPEGGEPGCVLPARAPSAGDAVAVGRNAAHEAIGSSQLESFTVQIDVGNFERGRTLTARAEAFVSLAPFPIVRQLLGQRFRLSWEASALVEPYRSRAP
jgi:hypothetical protein